MIALLNRAQKRTDMSLNPQPEGVLELHPKGYGFLRSPARQYLPQPTDPYVSTRLISKFGLREGVRLAGPLENARPSHGHRRNDRRNDRTQEADGPRLADVATIEGLLPSAYPRRDFDNLTPIDPHEVFRLETGQQPLTTRVMDLLTPIGKGQRGLIVAPPRTGKTVLLQHIAQAIIQNHPETHLVMLLIDERPEEVTDMRRTLKAEVIASNSDRETAAHIRMAELVFERARRMVEQGRHVFLLLDSLTRLARAYNKSVGNSGRTLSGGIDSRAMEVPRRMFGAARVFEEGGSLTVMASCLIDTGSRMDDYIFQEFKGTGNMELVLDRKLADRRIYPAMDITQSGTRKEERLLPPDVLKKVTLLRRSLVDLPPIQAMEALVQKLETFPSNQAFLERIATATK